MEPVRWGILGTASVAENYFIPALREAGDGVAVAVASRDGARARIWAAEHGVGRGLAGYGAIIDDPEIEAVYIPLPNGQHAQWTIAALEVGKAVLCEKPLCSTVEETRRVLEVAQSAAKPLWEAFVFPFHQQISRIREILASGRLGEVREIDSWFHVPIASGDDIPRAAARAGGAMQYVGCYPIRLARLLFGVEPQLSSALADADWAGGVDTDVWAALRFPNHRRLLFSCGFRGVYDAFARILTTEGEIRLTNPFHPKRSDTITVVHDYKHESQSADPSGELSFTPAVRHIQQVLRGLGRPRHLAADEAMGNANAVAAILAASRN